MLQIFSDASFWEGVSFVATIILKDWDTQITFFCKKYTSMDSCTIGEIMGVAQGLMWVLDNTPKEKNVEIYVDNLSVVKKLRRYLNTHRIKEGAYPAMWMYLYRLCDSFEKVSVFHVPSHQYEHNLNKTCDSLCSALLLTYKAAQRGELCTQ